MTTPPTPDPQQQRERDVLIDVLESMPMGDPSSREIADAIRAAGFTRPVAATGVTECERAAARWFTAVEGGFAWHDRPDIARARFMRAFRDAHGVDPDVWYIAAAAGQETGND